MIDIIIVGDYNDLTKECIASIHRTAIECNIVVTPFTGNYNQSLNNGLKGTTSDYICLANNDLIFQKGWKESVVSMLDYYDTVCPTDKDVHDIHNKPLVDVGFKKIDQFTGWCIFMRRDVLDRIGGKIDSLNNTPILFYRADAVFARQLMKWRMKNARIADLRVSHVGSATLNTVDERKYKELTVDCIRKVGRVKGFD